MILSTLVTSQLHFEMCAGLYGHPVFLFVSRAVSAALHTPQLGGPTLSQGTKIKSRHHLVLQRKLRPFNLKYEVL